VVERTSPAGETVYANRYVIWGRMAWGRMREYEVYEDTQKLPALDEYLAAGAPAGASTDDDLLRKLVADGRLVAPTRMRPTKAPQLVKSRRSASSLVLAERDDER
jgi:hypothetical protein